MVTHFSQPGSWPFFEQPGHDRGLEGHQPAHVAQPRQQQHQGHGEPQPGTSSSDWGWNLTLKHLKHQNVHLEHIDLSGNAITVTTDLSALKNLNTLMLHSNKITSLRQVSSSLSMSCWLTSCHHYHHPPLHAIGEGVQVRNDRQCTKHLLAISWPEDDGWCKMMQKHFPTILLSTKKQTIPGCNHPSGTPCIAHKTLTRDDYYGGVFEHHER